METINNSFLEVARQDHVKSSKRDKNMKVTLFTYDKIRHNYLIYLLSQICDKLFVVQEISNKK